MSDDSKPIEHLDLHEETIVQVDDMTLTTVMRVPNGLIYKFCEAKESSPMFELKSTQFVPYDWSTPKKSVLNS